MAVNILDERNAPIVGRKGDLVCTEPFPSMPLEFWGENGRQRYLDEYFSERDEVWTHGDLAEITVAGGIIISGRTDTTLKPVVCASVLVRFIESLSLFLSWKTRLSLVIRRRMTPKSGCLSSLRISS